MFLSLFSNSYDSFTIIVCIDIIKKIGKGKIWFLEKTKIYLI